MRKFLMISPMLHQTSTFYGLLILIILSLFSCSDEQTSNPSKDIQNESSYDYKTNQTWWNQHKKTKESPEKIPINTDIISEIRKHYYQTTEELTDYNKLSIRDTLLDSNFQYTIWLQNDQWRKLSITGDSMVTEYFYHESMDSLHPYFMYIVSNNASGKSEIRHYYDGDSLTKEIYKVNGEVDTSTQVKTDELPYFRLTWKDDLTALLSKSIILSAHPTIEQDMENVIIQTKNMRKQAGKENWKEELDECMCMETDGENYSIRKIYANGILRIKHELYEVDHHVLYRDIYYDQIGNLLFSNRNEGTWRFIDPENIVDTDEDEVIYLLPYGTLTLFRRIEVKNAAGIKLSNEPYMWMLK